jgi:hypothetical protein
MPTKIYDIDYVQTIYGYYIEVSPLKIKYMRQFMDEFDLVKYAQDENEIVETLTRCALVAMKQFCPEIETVEDFEDNFDLKSLYKIIEFAGGIKMQPEDDKDLDNMDEEQQAQQEGEEKASSKSGWDDLDLNKLESEAFLLGIWKNYDELESSICLAELMSILEQKREMDYQDKKFTASLKGIDLDSSLEKQEEYVDPWEAMKARVAAKASGIGNGNPNDITALQGIRAQQSGFGIGHGLDYEVVNEKA